MPPPKPESPAKRLQWRLECLGHWLIEALASLLPAAWAFRLGESLGSLLWHCLPLRRKIILRNLRIAFANEIPLPNLQLMAKASFRRTCGNLISASHTARLAPDKLGSVIQIENLHLLQQALAANHGVVLLLAHMGNWEILSRIVHWFPHASRAGAFYRPLNNPILDQQLLARRQADGTRMFSKRDNPLLVASFLRNNGIVGILADQRVGIQGELVPFCGRLTRVSPLPSLLARRAKSAVLALAVTTVKPGQWRAVFKPVESPPTTANCMASLEQVMKADPVDVFWLQERWKVYIQHAETIGDWLGAAAAGGGKPHRALLWLAGVADSWCLPAAWSHPDVIYEAVLAPGQERPGWLDQAARMHRVASDGNANALRHAIVAIDAAAALPLDFILTNAASHALVTAGRREAIPVVSAP